LSKSGYGILQYGSVPGRVRIFPVRRDEVWNPSSLLYKGYREGGFGKMAAAWHFSISTQNACFTSSLRDFKGTR
jgi:hypothetical protein